MKLINKAYFLSIYQNEGMTYEAMKNIVLGFGNAFEQYGEILISMKDGECVKLSDYVPR